jgi:L,D-transpeptidase YbiS
MNQGYRLEVSIDDQRLDLFNGGRLLASYPVSTAAKGVGFAEGSYRTPVGCFRIIEKIGDGEPSGTVFRGRVPCGMWRSGDLAEEDLVLTRILRLDGLEPANTNTLQRCIYIHGTNREESIGTPASHGCIRLRNADMLELFQQVPAGAVVVIHPPPQDGP